MKMQDYNFSVKFLQLIRHIVADEMNKRSTVRIATVVSWDRPNLVASVYFVESPDVVVKVNMGAVQPRIAGQKCRVERFNNDWFLTHIIDQGGWFATT